MGVVPVDLERSAPEPQKKGAESSTGWSNIMGDKVKLRFYPEADYLEVTFSDAHGYMRPTESDAVMKRVDEQGRIIGFSVFGVTRFQKNQLLEVELIPGTDFSR